MESKVNYSLVGMFVLVLLAATALTAWWLASGGSGRQYTPYLVYATDSVSGLNADSRVYFNGVDVGRVDDIRIDRSNPERIRIRVLIDETVPVLSTTSAQLRPQGVTGLSVLNLQGGAGGEELRAEEGQCCPVIPYEPSLFSKLEGGINETMVQVLEVSRRLERVLSDDNLAHMERTLENLETFSSSLAAERDHLASLLRDASRTAENTAEITASGRVLVRRAESTLTGLDRRIADLSATMDALQATAADVSEAAESTVAFTRAGERTADDISRRTLPEISLLIRDLRDLSRRLADFTSALDKDPSRLIFGGEERPPGPGEGE
jgi:phospholipid/cholesterol/gamma-HCH transport system substrate-binding protein